jgi:hypothetical protein
MQRLLAAQLMHGALAVISISGPVRRLSKGSVVVRLATRTALLSRLIGRASSASLCSTSVVRLGRLAVQDLVALDVE